MRELGFPYSGEQVFPYSRGEQVFPYSSGDQVIPYCDEQVFPYSGGDQVIPYSGETLCAPWNLTLRSVAVSMRALYTSSAFILLSLYIPSHACLLSCGDHLQSGSGPVLAHSSASLCQSPLRRDPADEGSAPHCHR